MAQRILNLSEASVLAFHAAGLMAASTRRLTAAAMASRLGVSEAHLSKVLQRLTRAGLLRSTRGPGGGFCLKRSPGEISLLDIYESIEGPLQLDDCLLEEKCCSGKNCLFRGLLERVNLEFEDYLRSTRLATVEDVIGGD